MKKQLNKIIKILLWPVPKKLICYFFGHRYWKWRFATQRVVKRDKDGQMEVVYDIYETVKCSRCGKAKDYLNRKGNNAEEKQICRGLTFEQACLFVPSLKKQAQ